MKTMPDHSTCKPDWVPEDAGDAFATKIVKGKSPEKDLTGEEKHKTKRSSQLSIDEHIDGVLSGNRTVLGRTITLIESNSQQHREKAQQVLQAILPHAGKSLRIGISGVPGAGKSTLIETFGCYLTGTGHKVAVLAVDPSSTVTKGSILGDKTRMEKLSRDARCFIRPSPSGGTLGGVTRKSRETVLVCEAAGYDCILIETVGVGQSEITVRSMVDFFLLVMIAGAGDELQGIKKGVIEIADALVINKADGSNIRRANLARSEYENALKYIQPATRGWKTPVFTCSALTGAGIEMIWHTITEFRKTAGHNGAFSSRRKEQSLEWMFSLVEEQLKENFYHHPEVRQALSELKNHVMHDRILPTLAAEKLLSLFSGH